MVQSVERLPGKHKALSLVLSFLVKSQEWQCTLTVPSAGKTRSLRVSGGQPNLFDNSRSVGEPLSKKQGAALLRNDVRLSSCFHVHMH